MRVPHSPGPPGKNCPVAGRNDWLCLIASPPSVAWQRPPLRGLDLRWKQQFSAAKADSEAADSRRLSADGISGRWDTGLSPRGWGCASLLPTMLANLSLVHTERFDFNFSQQTKRITFSLKTPIQLVLYLKLLLEFTFHGLPGGQYSISGQATSSCSFIHPTDFYHICIAWQSLEIEIWITMLFFFFFINSCELESNEEENKIDN